MIRELYFYIMISSCMVCVNTGGAFFSHATTYFLYVVLVYINGYHVTPDQMHMEIYFS